MVDTSYLPLWDKNFIDTSPIADLTATIKAGTIYQTIEFHNTSRYQLLITLQPVGGQPKVIIPAWSTKQFISPGSTLYVSVDTSYPADTNVSTTLLSAEKIYALLKTGIEAPYVLPLSVQTSSIITSGAVNATITGTTDVNVTNIPTITIDSSGNTVNVGNTIDANVTGAVTANLPAGSSIEVTQASGSTLDVTVNSGSTLDVTGSTVDVQTPSGSTLNVGGTITVGNPTLNVTTATGDSVTVAGTIDIGNTPAVTVNSGSVDANITNASLTVGSVGSITSNVNSQVVNDYVTNNPFVTSATETMPSTTIPVGGSAGFMMPVPVGVYDAATLYAYFNNSPNGLSGITFQCAQIRYQVGSEASTFVGFGQNWSFPYNTDDANLNNVSALLPFNGEYLCNNIYILMTNTNTVSVTINFQFTLFLRYASQQISNTTSAPVYQQPTLGAFNTIYPVQLPGTIVDGGTSVTETIVPSSDGGYIKTIVIAGIIANGSTWSIDINNDSTTLVTLYSDVYGANQFYLQFPLSDGIANNGLTVVINNGTSSVNLNAWLSVYATLTQQGGATVQAAIQ